MCFLSAGIMGSGLDKGSVQIRKNNAFLFGELGHSAEMMWSRVPSATPSLLSSRTVRVLMAKFRHVPKQSSATDIASVS